MLKKTITFEDLDGNSISEDFYFNLSKAEIAEMELSEVGGFGAALKAMVEDGNAKAIISTFKDILSRAIGQRDENGKRFIKSEEISLDFLQTDAYSVLFMELVTDADAATQFITGIIPADLRGDLDKPVVPPNLTTVKDVALPETLSTEVVTPEVPGDTNRMSIEEMREALRKADENNPK